MAAVIAAHQGPKSIADRTSAVKPSPIFMRLVFIARGRVKITSIAISMAVIASFFVVFFMYGIIHRIRLKSNSEIDNSPALCYDYAEFRDARIIEEGRK